MLLECSPAGPLEGTVQEVSGVELYARSAGLRTLVTGDSVYVDDSSHYLVGLRNAEQSRGERFGF